MRKSMKRYGNWALVTGASSGIGRAMAEKLSQDGVNCILVSEDIKNLEETSRRIEAAYQTKTVVCCCDLTNSGFFNEINEKIRGIDIDILIWPFPWHRYRHLHKYGQAQRHVLSHPLS